jgi:hypothetical protein
MKSKSTVVSQLCHPKCSAGLNNPGITHHQPFPHTDDEIMFSFRRTCSVFPAPIVWARTHPPACFSQVSWSTMSFSQRRSRPLTCQGFRMRATLSGMKACMQNCECCDCAEQTGDAAKQGTMDRSTHSTGHIFKIQLCAPE